MNKEELEKEGQNILANIKRFVTSKDLFVFTLFLFLSAALWVLHALKEKYETMIVIPVNYTNLPNQYITKSELPSSLRITIVGQGTNLIAYRWASKLDPIDIDLSKVTIGKNTIHSQDLIQNLKKQIKSETQITKVSPDVFSFDIEKLAQKKVRIKLNGSFELAQQYTFCDSIEMEPNYVMAYGPQDDIDSLYIAISEETNLSDIKDTLTQKIKLIHIPHITFSDSIINLTIRTERFTEKQIQTPISIINLPKDRQLRIFPSSVSAICRVGLSNYDKIDASSFTFVVDYKETSHHKNKLPIEIKESPKEVFNIKLETEEVDYIIEEKFLPQ
jgi:hypothetical protein